MKRQHLLFALISLTVIAAVFLYNSMKNKELIKNHLGQGKPVLVKLFAGKTTQSFRGIDAINDSIVWVSGNLGTFGKSLNGGEHWVFGKISGADSIDFRDIHLVNEQTAVVLGVGNPTAFYKTTNGGNTWHLVYYTEDERQFFNAFDFWSDGTGIAFGDPINNRLALLKTKDFGETWVLDTTSGPQTVPGEAGFAASGSSLRCYGDSTIYIVSGGTRCQLYFSENRGAQWRSIALPMLQGNPSQGGFSLVAHDNGVSVVGGDYINNEDTTATIVTVTNNSEMRLGKGLPYQGTVCATPSGALLSFGTMGGYISTDGGMHWQQFSEDAMHALTVSKNGQNIFATGPQGRIGRVVFNVDQ
jgi:photosystem II stability/assembly factor-like uncharacterized protein